MRYLDVYKNCNGCPVSKYCGTAVGSIKLCNSYNDQPVETDEREEPVPEEVIVDWIQMENDY